MPPTEPAQPLQALQIRVHDDDDDLGLRTPQHCYCCYMAPIEGIADACVAETLYALQALHAKSCYVTLCHAMSPMSRHVTHDTPCHVMSR